MTATTWDNQEKVGTGTGGWQYNEPNLNYNSVLDPDSNLPVYYNGIGVTTSWSNGTKTSPSSWINDTKTSQGSSLEDFGYTDWTSVTGITWEDLTGLAWGDIWENETKI